MSVITLRSTKGSPLTNAEMDLNFFHLNSDKMEKASNFADLGNVTEAKTNLDLELVDNTRDIDKPISTDTANALALKANEVDLDAAVLSLSNGITAVAESIPVTVIAERTAAATLANKTLTDPVINGFTGTARQKSANALGYDVGAGGGVTQLVSKSTAVTLNKPCGRIITFNDVLAANTLVTFTFTNSLLSANDIVAFTLADGNGYKYNVWAYAVSAGSCQVAFKNITGSSLSEAIPICFAVIKGSTT